MEELRRLADSQDNVPDKERFLEACTGCAIMLSKEQWREVKKLRIGCPNRCYEGGIVDTTDDYTGVISIMLPSRSWVAQWNEKQTYVPGLYAMHLNKANEEEEEEYDRGGQDSFVENSDEGEQMDQDLQSRASRSQISRHRQNPERDVTMR